MYHATHVAMQGHGSAPFRHLAGTVLLVDDEVDVLDGLSRGLRHSDFRVLCAAGPDEALAILARERIDVVVSDLKMPGRDGLELLDLVRERHPDCIRILLTGHPSAESAIDAINHEEIFRYLTKPVSRDHLEATLRVAFERLRERRELVTRAPEREAPRGPVLSPEERSALRDAFERFGSVEVLPPGLPPRRR